MDKIQHKYVDARGLKLHIAEIGTGDQVVFFLHGFPEIWYSWRYQMIAVANAGYRAIAPDVRGYGLSEIPQEPEKSTFLELVNDLAAIFDSLAISKAFVIGKDFGALTAYQFAILHPEKVTGLVTCGIPYMPPGGIDQLLSLVPEGFYISRWKEPAGRAEADFGRLEVKNVVRNIYVLFSKSELPIADEDKEIMDLVDESHPLPSWFTEDDLSAYAALYEKSGFRTALQVPYRSLAEGFPISNPIIKTPALLIMGGKDYVLKLPGMEEYITSGGVKEHVPDLEIKFLPQGSHFVQEQDPDEVNELIITFLKKCV
ncbi:hypothetical protein C5167_000612 [Papaver somniferum]|uniref:AB hydrolase-1 domain-containing protein n=1 Tax=Papaver somniferum TaxID=3469 RepID=A0A4Y7KSX4_PAPSO|nr:uncharacterized protein LOC113310527 [Papaver somniferum]RZC76453.1 hypothetical protein C5167_000612 [Papaver somniferum]